MTEKKTVYANAYGVRRTLITDDERPGDVIVQTEQDIEPILDGVARDRELFRNDGVNKVIGRVPVAVVEKAALEHWDESDWRRWWNGEGRAFRIWRPGAQL